MADVKVSLTGDELAELRNLLSYQAGKISTVQLKLGLEMCGYHNFECITFDEQVSYIAEKLLKKLR